MIEQAAANASVELQALRDGSERLDFAGDEPESSKEL
jgi:hypothetical protein